MFADLAVVADADSLLLGKRAPISSPALASGKLAAGARLAADVRLVADRATVVALHVVAAVATVLRRLSLSFCLKRQSLPAAEQECSPFRIDLECPTFA